MKLFTEYWDKPMREGRALDWLPGESGSAKPALFFIHGGGWRGGSRQRYHRLMEYFQERGYWCGSTDYRLSGVRIGDQLADVRTGYDLFRRRLNENDGPSSVVVLGSSAGAHLSLLLGLSAPGDCGEPVEEKVRDQWEAPKAVIVQAAPVRFEEWPEMFPPIYSDMKNIAGFDYKGHESEWLRFSPVKHLKKGAPSLLFLHADNEHMFPLEQIQEFAEQAKNLDVEVHLKTYSPAEHGFLYDYVRPVQKRALADVEVFLQTVAGSGLSSGK